MTRQIQQQTFDHIVKESIEDFGLTPEEAIQDAIDQLKKAGVTDFSNISTTPSTDNRDIADLDEETNPVPSMVDAIGVALGNGSSPTAFQEAIDKIIALPPQYHSQVPVGTLSQTLSKFQDHPQVITTVCKFITKICANDDANRLRLSMSSDTDFHTPLKSLIDDIAEKSHISSSTEEELKRIQNILSATAALQRRNERMKRRMATHDTPKHILSIFRQAGSSSLQSELHCDLFCAVSTVIVQWLTQGENDVDPRIEVAECFTRARVLAGENTVTESGLRSLPPDEENLIVSVSSLASKLCQFSEDTKESDQKLINRRRKCVRECLSIARSNAQSDEMCKNLFESGFIQTSARCLRHYVNDELLVTICIQTLSKLSQRDACKSSIFSDAMSTVTEAIRPFFTTSERIITAYLWLVARLCLRRPDISKHVASTGVTDIAVSVMKKNLDKLEVVRAGCHLLRNVCSRDEEAKRRVRERSNGEGPTEAEAVVREVMNRWGKRCDVAYYTLEGMDVLEDSEMRWDSRYGNRPSAKSSCVSGSSRI